MLSKDPSSNYERFDELAEEFADRFRRGERPAIEEYVARLPEMADEIREMFPALVVVERVDEDARVVGASNGVGPTGALRELGDYRVLREIGRGGMGIVYEAEQVSLGRRVALKVLPSHVVNDSNALERFRREARAAAALHHTNIVPVFDVGQDNEVAFYAMQFIQGQGLDRVIDELIRLRDDSVHVGSEPPPGRGPADSGQTAAIPVGGPPADETLMSVAARAMLTGRFATSIVSPAFDPVGSMTAVVELAPSGNMDLPALGEDASGSAVLPGGTAIRAVSQDGRHRPYYRSVAHLGSQAAQALEYAHARRIIHRDIKPSNLLLDTSGVVWITDFGLAKTDDEGLTATGDILGTIRYMAPERFRGESDVRSDIYALGLTLYELLTLRPAFPARDRLELIQQIQATDPARPRQVDARIPFDLETIVLKAIDKQPEQRYPSAQALGADLQRFLSDEPILARQSTVIERYARWVRRNPWVAGLSGVLTAVLVLASLISFLAASRLAALADRERASANSERQAREDAERARAVAQSETCHALLSEVRALRAGRRPGWRASALANLARLADLPGARSQLQELRSEAVATLGGFDIEEVARFEPHRGIVWALDISRDSRTLATASMGGSVDFWDVPARRHLSHVPAVVDVDSNELPRTNEGRIRFLPDGSLAMIAPDGSVKFLDRWTAAESHPPLTREGLRAIHLETDGEGRWLAVAWTDLTIELRDARTRETRRTFAPRDVQRGADPFLLALSGDGRTLASIGQGQPLLVRSTEGEEPAVEIPNEANRVHSLALSWDGKRIVPVGPAPVARVYERETQQEKFRLHGHRMWLNWAGFSRSGDWLATASRDNTTRIWNARTGEPQTILPSSEYNLRARFSQDGEFLAIVTRSPRGTVSLYRLRERGEYRELVTHNRAIQGVSFHPNQPALATASDDRTIAVWNLTTLSVSARWQAHDDWITAIAYSPDGSQLISARGTRIGRTDFVLSLWDSATGRKIRDLPSGDFGTMNVAWRKDGRAVVSGDQSGTVRVWELDQPSPTVLTRGDGRNILGVRFLGDGRILATDGGANLRILAFPSGEVLGERQLDAPCTSLVVDEPRGRIIGGDSGGRLSSWSLDDLRPLPPSVPGHAGAIQALALTADGKRLVSGGQDRRAVLRDALTLEPLLSFPEWSGALRDAEFHASGRWLAYNGYSIDAAIWDIELLSRELEQLGLGLDGQPRPSPVEDSLWTSPTPITVEPDPGSRTPVIPKSPRKRRRQP